MHKMLYSHSSVGNTINYVYKLLTPEDKLFVPRNPVLIDNEAIRYVRTRGMSYIVVHDYRSHKYKRYHPVSGLYVSVASVNSSRGNGSTDYLIRQAIDDIELIDDLNGCLIAEIDNRNSYSIELFKRNGFVPIFENGNDIYYSYYLESKECL